MEMTFPELAQRDAIEWVSRLEILLNQIEPLLVEGQGLGAAIDAKVGVPSPLGLPPSYPGLKGPVVALLRPAELRAAIARWRVLRAEI